MNRQSPPNLEYAFHHALRVMSRNDYDHDYSVLHHQFVWVDTKLSLHLSLMIPLHCNCYWKHRLLLLQTKTLSFFSSVVSVDNDDKIEAISTNKTNREGIPRQKKMIKGALSAVLFEDSYYSSLFFRNESALMRTRNNLQKFPPPKSNPMNLFHTPSYVVDICSHKYTTTLIYPTPLTK